MATQNGATIEWYRVPIERDELRRLTARSDAKALAQSVGFLSVLAATATVSWIAWETTVAGNFPLWGLAALLFLHGTAWHFLLNGFHELVHFTVFKTRWLGTVFLYAYSFLGWHDPVFFRLSHTRHHLYTLHPPRDREVQLPIRMRFRHFMSSAIVDPMGLYRHLRGTVIKAMGRTTGAWQDDLLEESGPGARQKLVWYNRLFLAGHLLIVGFAIATGWFQLIVLITLANWYGRWLEFLCNETQHIGLVDNVPDFRLCCRTFTAGPLIRFLYWNMNYHTEHHMYAAVPCYHLHRLHRLVKHELPESTHGIAATWRQVIQILRRQSADPEYRFIAELPERRAPGSVGE